MRWPPSHDVHGDEQNAARFVACLGYTESDWDDAHSLVRDILRQPHVRRASSELFFRLLETPILDGDTARAIYDAADDAQVTPSGG